jgi:hypothetical protein
MLSCVILTDSYVNTLVSFFVQFIPNQIYSSEHSKLSNRIIAIINATIHSIRKPPHLQHLHYSRHYKMHGMLTHLLIDFEGNIIALETNVLGSIHDTNAASHNFHFPKILGANFYALGDPGYAGVPYVVAGLKSNQLKEKEDQEFDTLSREEQILIEHVNRFLKACIVLSKNVVFKHSRVMHVSCVIICCGWYNMMKTKYGLFERQGA